MQDIIDDMKHQTGYSNLLDFNDPYKENIYLEEKRNIIKDPKIDENYFRKHLRVSSQNFSKPKPLSEDWEKINKIKKQVLFILNLVLYCKFFY